MALIVLVNCILWTQVSRWDKSKDSLSSTLHQILPNIFAKMESPPIPNHPPTLSKKYNIRCK
jgi:hypothetical protein